MNNVCTVTLPRISSLGLRAVRVESNIPWRSLAYTNSDYVLIGPRLSRNWNSSCASRLTSAEALHGHIQRTALRGRPTISKQLQLLPTTIAGNTAWLWRQASTHKRPVKRASQHGKLHDLSREKISEIFGPTVDRELGNKILQNLQKQRITGTLDAGLSDSGLNENIIGNALAWLRLNYPVDEDAAIIARLEEEERQVDQELLSRAERMGIYRPQQDVEKTGIYGKSGLEAIKEHYENLRAVKSQADGTRNAAGDSVTVQQPEARAVVARRTRSAEWVERYKEKAILSKDTQPPNMTKWSRLYPSALIVILVVGASILIAQNYVPPPRSARLFPDIPPAAATILALIVGNALVLVMWRLPPMWRFMNMYFLMIPGLPKSWSVLGNTVSHQSVTHYFGNMAVLWFIGTRLHDDIGRGSFLAVYFSSGVLSSFFSLSSFVLRNNLITSSLGASGAMAGVIATWCSLHSGEKFSFIFLPAELNPALSSNLILGALLAYEIVGVVRGSKKIDHWSHLGGYMTGLVCAQTLKYQQRQRKQEEVERQKKLGFLNHMKQNRI